MPKQLQSSSNVIDLDAYRKNKKRNRLLSLFYKKPSKLESLSSQDVRIESMRETYRLLFALTLLGTSLTIASSVSTLEGKNEEEMLGSIMASVLGSLITVGFGKMANNFSEKKKTGVNPNSNNLRYLFKAQQDDVE